LSLRFGRRHRRNVAIRGLDLIAFIVKAAACTLKAAASSGAFFEKSEARTRRRRSALIRHRRARRRRCPRRRWRQKLCIARFAAQWALHPTATTRFFVACAFPTGNNLCVFIPTILVDDVLTITRQRHSWIVLVMQIDGLETDDALRRAVVR
jgi:hypothetical protein